MNLVRCEQGGLWQQQVSKQERGQGLSLEQPAWLTGSACSFIFNSRSIKKHCRALIRGVGYPDSGFYCFLWLFGEWTVVGWKVGSQGGGVVVPGMRGDDGLDLGSGCGMQRHGWITDENLEKGMECVSAGL